MFYEYLQIRIEFRYGFPAYRHSTQLPDYSHTGETASDLTGRR